MRKSNSIKGSKLKIPKWSSKGFPITILPIIKSSQQLAKIKQEILQLDKSAEQYAREGDVEKYEIYFDRARSLEGYIPIPHKVEHKGARIVKRRSKTNFFLCSRGGIWRNG